MKKMSEQKKRINFLYYEEGLTQKEISELLNISRQRVNAILNSNKDHELRKAKRSENKIINRKVQFPRKSSPSISIPKDMLNRIGITEEFKNVEIRVQGDSIIIIKK